MIVKKLIRIATRKSPLALWQANHIAQQLQQLFPNITTELLPLVTSGDRFLKDKLQALGGKGLFVKELEDALLTNRADLAVHSMKDVPADIPGGLELVAICRRDNPFDVMISQKYQSLDLLPQGAIVGTASLRRQSQLLAYRADLSIKILRGNVQTRLNKLEKGEYDAIILAAAGIERLGIQPAICQYFDETLMLPACGQGALGLECRRNDLELHSLLSALNDENSTICVGAERRVNAQLGGNCHVPLAVFAKIDQQQLILQAKIIALDGQLSIFEQHSGPITQALAIADQCAKALLARGAASLLHGHS